MNLNFSFAFQSFCENGKKTQGHNRTENAKYANSLSLARPHSAPLLDFSFCNSQKYVYLVGLVQRFTSSSFVGTQNSTDSTAYILCTYTFPWQRWWPHYFMQKEETTPWHFSAICSNFLLPSPSLFLSRKRENLHTSLALKCVFPSFPNGREKMWWKTFRKYIAHSSSFQMRCAMSWFIFCLLFCFFFYKAHHKMEKSTISIQIVCKLQRKSVCTAFG